MQRKTNWPSALHAYMESVKHASFQYGVYDCGLFAAGCIEAMTGLDLAADFRGYANRLGAMDACRQVCKSASIPKVGEYVASTYGLNAVPVLMAQRGDLAVVRNRRFGIVALTGGHVMVPGKYGVILFPLKSATKVYRV
jgi:hypothetical protein